MRETIDWPPRRPPQFSPPSSPRNRRLVILLAVVVLLVVFGGQSWLSYYVDALWFGSLGYAAVFWKTLGLQWAVFAVLPRLPSSFFMDLS